MNIQRIHKQNRQQRGSAVIVVIAILTIMMICVTINLGKLRTVRQQIDFTNHQQMQRWQHQTAPQHP